MELLLAMLPVYLLGNLHCIGMCGPLVMLIGQHRYRYFYFAGRTLSFTLAGVASGAVGAAINVTLRAYNIPAITGLLFGCIILLIGVRQLFGVSSGPAKPGGISARINQSISLLMLQDRRFPIFLFGLFTVALPCGQTLVVYSACAMSGDAKVGLINGLAFAVLTSPSLLLAMHAQNWLAPFKKHYRLILGLLAIAVGSFATYRGAVDYRSAKPTCPMCHERELAMGTENNR